MKRISILIAAAMMLAAPQIHAQYRPGWTDLDDSETVRAFKEHVSYISSPSMRGRAAGSEGELETAIYVTNVFKDYGLDVLSGPEGDLFGMKQESGDTLTSRNVAAFLQGYDKSLNDRYIVVGARMDNIGVRNVTIDGVPTEKIYYGANGNASGLAMMLELARLLRTNSLLLRRSVIFVAFGSSMESNAGSWYFLNRTFSAPEKIDAMINLDVLGIPVDGLLAFMSSNADMTKIATDLSNTLQPVQPKVTTLEPLASDHRSFYAKEIPSVMFTTGPYFEYGSDRDTADKLDYEMMERELEYIYNYSVTLANGPKPVFNPSAEEKPLKNVKGAVPYYDCDYKPTFLGHSDPAFFLEKWVYQYLRYPQACVENGIQGKVLVDFVIDERGKVTDVKVLKGCDQRLEDEAVRVFSASPDWKPGRVKGQKVKAEMSLYVEFRLEKKKKK